MVSGCQFRHHATIQGMQIHLTEEGMSQQTSLRAVQSKPRLVTGTLDSQNDHGACLPCIRVPGGSREASLDDWQDGCQAESAQADAVRMYGACANNAPIWLAI
jgi:hypothetical protein